MTAQIFVHQRTGSLGLLRLGFVEIGSDLSAVGELDSLQKKQQLKNLNLQIMFFDALGYVIQLRENALDGRFISKKKNGPTLNKILP